MSFRGCEIRKEAETLHDGDVVFAALLCDLDSCLGPAVRAVWYTPEHLEACSNKQSGLSRASAIDVLNNEAMSRVAQRALAAHMLDTKLLSFGDEDTAPASLASKCQAQVTFLLKTYLVPLRSDFDMLLAKQATPTVAHDEFVAMCVLVFPIRDSSELAGLLLFFDLHHTLDAETESESDFEDYNRLHTARELPTSVVSQVCESLSRCDSVTEATEDALLTLPMIEAQSQSDSSNDSLTEECTEARSLSDMTLESRARVRADWLRRTVQMIGACFELKVRKLARARDSDDCVASLNAFLTGACSLYSRWTGPSPSLAMLAKPDAKVDVCHCSLVKCLLRTVTESDKRFLQAAVGAHVAARRTVVVGANYHAVHAVLQLLQAIVCDHSEDVRGDRFGGIWRTQLTRDGRSRALLSGLPDGSALFDLQGVVPPGDAHGSLFASEELLVDNEFLFANERPLALVYVHVQEASLRLTGSVFRMRELSTKFGARREAFLSATAQDQSRVRCVLRSIYLCDVLQSDPALECDVSSLVGALLNSLVLLADRINPYARSARQCIADCLHAFWTDVRCRSFALRHFPDWQPMAYDTAKETLFRLQGTLANLLDLRSELDFHILCAYLRCEPN